LSEKLVAIIPDSSGEGVIPGFAEALAGIVEYLGAEAFITSPDEKGLLEAEKRNASLVLTSSDDLFVCRDRRSSHVAENGRCTGLGFAQALLAMAGDAKGRTVLVIGAGPVGLWASRRLTAKGAKVVCCDIVPERAQEVTRLVPEVKVFQGRLEEDLKSFDFIVEASTSSTLWSEEYVKKGACLAAPGMPFSFSFSDRYKLWSEPLATGTAVMLVDACLAASAIGDQ
jgi:pyrrolysine biosynthesis protein PylD